MKAVIINNYFLIWVFALTVPALSQVPSLMWDYELDSQCYGSPACADIDNDGYLEIVFGTYFDDEHAYALNAEDGSLCWRVYTGGGPLDAAPVIYDVDQDGELEVIMPASWGRIYCLSGDGSIEWQYPSTGYIECIDSPPAIADTDEDGMPEIIFGAWYGKLYVLNGEDGSLNWQRTYDPEGYVQSAPCILDCDMNGHLDIVFAMFRGNCKVYAVAGQNGDTLWTYQAADWMYAGTSAADIDLDGLPELVIGDYSGVVFALEAENGAFKWERSIGYYVFPPTSIGDAVIDSPGLEILAADDDLYCLSSSGSIIWTYPTGGLIDRGAVFAEIDGDINPEIVFGSSDCYLRVVNSEDGSLVWQEYTDYGYPIENAPVVEDFDLDGWVDIFCIGGRGYSDTIPNFGRAYAFRAGDAGPLGGDNWTMYRHDPYRNASEYYFPTGIEEDDYAVPHNISTSSYPNPFNASTIISFNLLEPSNVRVEVFDLLGRSITTLLDEEKQAGNHQFTWNAANQSSGVYFYRIQASDYMITKKMVMLK